MITRYAETHFQYQHMLCMTCIAITVSTLRQKIKPKNSYGDWDARSQGELPVRISDFLFIFFDGESKVCLVFLGGSSSRLVATGGFRRILSVSRIRDSVCMCPGVAMVTGRCGSHGAPELSVSSGTGSRLYVCDRDARLSLLLLCPDGFCGRTQEGAVIVGSEGTHSRRGFGARSSGFLVAQLPSASIVFGLFGRANPHFLRRTTTISVDRSHLRPHHEYTPVHE